MSSRGIGAEGAEPGAGLQSLQGSLNGRLGKKREARPPRPDFNPERALDAYFAVMMIVIVAMIVGLAFYTVRYVIPESERHRSPQNQHDLTNPQFESPQLFGPSQ